MLVMYCVRVVVGLFCVAVFASVWAPPAFAQTAPASTLILIPETQAPVPHGLSIPLTQPISVVPVPVTLNLQTLLDQVQDALPKELDADGAWTPIERGINVKYRVWRSAPAISVAGNSISVDLDINYRFEAGIRVRNGGIVGGYSIHHLASCGSNEQPAQAHVKVTYVVNWRQDYHLAVGGNWFIHYTPCNLTADNISGIRFVRPQVEPRIADAAAKLQTLIANIDFRELATGPWAAMQGPIHTNSMDRDLYIRPIGISASPPDGAGTVFKETFVLLASVFEYEPPVTSGGTPPADPFPPSVPPPTMGVLASPGSGEFRLLTLERLPFSQATALAKQRLDGSPVDILNKHSTITVISVAGRGPLAYLELRLDGGLQGTIFLTGQMAYDATTNTFYIHSLTLTPEETAAYNSPLIASFQDPAFLASIEPKLRWDLGPHLSTFKSDANARLANIDLGHGFLIHGSVTAFTPTSFTAYPEQCEVGMPPTLCVDGLDKSTFVVGVEAQGAVTVVHP
jgi:hypothetical protein